MGSEAFSRSEPHVLLGFPFAPGEEELAREFLAQPLKTPDLRVSKKALRLRFGLWALTNPVGGVLIALPFATFTVWLGGDWSVMWLVLEVMLGFVVFAALVFWGLTPGVGPLIVSGSEKAVALGGKTVARFAEIGVPRLVMNHSVLIDENQLGSMEVPAVVMTRQGGKDLVIFDARVPSPILRRIPEFADHINALLVECQQRELVAQWLSERDALTSNQPYR